MARLRIVDADLHYWPVCRQYGHFDPFHTKLEGWWGFWGGKRVGRFRSAGTPGVLRHRGFATSLRMTLVKARTFGSEGSEAGGLVTLAA